MILARIGYSLELIGATPPAAIGAPASYTFTARGGLSPYELTVVSEDLPPDWTAADNGDGTLTLQSSNPQDAGDYSLTIRVTDANRVSVDTPFSLTVIALPVSISFTSLPDGTEGTPYTGQATAQYGTTPYTYTKVAGPAWLSVNPSTGAITGTPTAEGSGITVTVQVEDANAVTAQVTDTIDIVAIPSYTTLNPSDKGANITLSNGDLTAVNSAAAWQNVQSVATLAQGNWYVELHYDSSSVANGPMLGVCPAATGVSTFAGSGVNQASIYSSSGSTIGTWIAGAFDNPAGHGSAGGVGSYMGLALRVAVDGSIRGWARTSAGYVGGGDPVANTSPTFTCAAGSYQIALSSYNTAQGTMNFGASSFNFSLPSGFAGVPE